MSPIQLASVPDHVVAGQTRFHYVGADAQGRKRESGQHRKAPPPERSGGGAQGICLNPEISEHQPHQIQGRRVLLHERYHFLPFECRFRAFLLKESSTFAKASPSWPRGLVKGDELHRFAYLVLPVVLCDTGLSGRLVFVVPQPEGAWERPVVIRAGGVAAAVWDLHEFKPVIQGALRQRPGGDRRAALGAVSLCHGSCPPHAAGRMTNMECTMPTSTCRGASR